MNYRMANLLSEVTYTDDVTKTIDINLTDPISEIVIKARPHTVCPSAASDAHPVTVLEKIEIVDGSDVLYSLDGLQAHALDIYSRDRQRNPWYMYLTDNYMECPVGINFGRYLWDEQLAFDPTKFNNPQLKITIDEDGEGSQFDAVKLKVDAAVFDERAITPQGFLMAKELKEYTMGSADHEYTTLPTDYMYRKMFVQARTLGTEPNFEIDTIKLSENHDKKIPFNGIDFMDILNTISYMHPPVEDILYQWCGTVSTQGRCTPTTRVVGVVNSWMLAGATNSYMFYDGDGGRFFMHSSTGNANINAMVRGYLPHGVFEIPFGDPMKIDDWYDVPALKSLEADIKSKSGGDGDECKIFLEQLRNY